MPQLAHVTNYAETITVDDYIYGIRAHRWIACMYELMRQRALEVAKDHLTRGPSAHVLMYDLGCGPGHLTHALALDLAFALGRDAHRVTIIGIDNSLEFIDYATRRNACPGAHAHPCVYYHHGDVLTDHQLHEPADVIFASGFLHRFTPDEKPQVLSMIPSLLKHNGYLIHGDEHPAPYEWFAMRFPNANARHLSLCALYFQVISAAQKSRHLDLMEMEVENLISELYRDTSGFPRISRPELMHLVIEAAQDFMRLLHSNGLEAACTRSDTMLRNLGARDWDTHHNHGFCDRGDHKIPLPDFIKLAAENGLAHVDTCDTGDCEVIGSAPVVVFKKKYA